MTNQTEVWKKRVLVPFWFLRIGIMLFLIGLYSNALRAVEGIGEFAKPAIASIVVFMLFIIICLLIDILAIVLFMRDALRPGTFLTMNCFQAGFFGGVLIMDLVAAMRGTSAAGIGFSVFVFLTFVGLLIYSAVGYRRAKKQAQRGNYVSAYNPATPTAYAPQYQGAPPYEQNNTYIPQVAAPVQLQNNHYPPLYQTHGVTSAYRNQQSPKLARMA